MVKVRFGKRLFLTLAMAALFMSAGTVHATVQSSGSYTMERDLLSGGGGGVSSTNYGLLFSLGQSSTVGASSSASYGHHAGFWCAAFCLKGDANDSRVVDILDAITALRIFLQLEQPPADTCAVDLNGDQTVNILDVVNIMRLSMGGAL